MRLNQLADQLDTKTIGLIAIAKALDLPNLPNPNGGTPLGPAQQQQIAEVYRYMQARQIALPSAAIVQMKATSDSIDSDDIAVRIRASVADELRSRYPTGSMSDRILRLLGAVQSFEQLHRFSVQPQAIAKPLPGKPPAPPRSPAEDTHALSS